METALYHEEHGYYASPAPKVGKKGDFITSVSVGAAFGKILAHRLAHIWEDQGRPSPFSIIEMGADRGDLAYDICTELNTLVPECHWHYHIIEPREESQLAQSKKLKIFQESISIHPTIETLHGLEGVFLSNELIDAFPVEIIQLQQGQWMQLFIEVENGHFRKTWKQPTTPELQSFITTLGTDFSPDYTTEFRPGLDSFFSKVAAALTRGLIITVDYGFPRSHFYDPKRSEGTLQTYQNHQRGTDPLEAVGRQDITTHVDFTQLANAQIKHGFQVHDFTAQARFLTHHGKAWLLQLEQHFTPQSLPSVQQFQTLTHPDFLGSKFHVLETAKGFLPSSPPITNGPLEVLEIPS